MPSSCRSSTSRASRAGAVATPSAAPNPGAEPSHDERRARERRRTALTYRDLREFMGQLEQGGELKRVALPVSPHLEMTAVCDRVLRAGGPALLFERPT